MFGRETILNKIPAGGGCTDIVDNYDPFGGNGVALYQLNGNANDVSGNYNGTASNVTYGTGVFGQAGVFNGSSSFINLGASSQFSASAVTFSLWYKPDTVSNIGALLANTNGGSYELGEFYWYQWNDGKFLISYGQSSTTYVQYFSTSTFSVGTWYFLSFVIDPSATNKFRLYINGAEDTLVVNNQGGTFTAHNVLDNSLQLNMGKRNISGSENYLDGSLDQVRIFNTALDPLEVEALYTEELCICDGTVDTLDILGDGSCIATYQLDGNANDLSGNYSGTPTDVSYGVGEFDLAGVFNGSSSKIAISQDFGIGDISKNWTSSVWAKTDSTSSEQIYFARQTNNHNVSFNGGNTIEIAFYLAAGGSDIVITGVTASNWNHIVVSHNASTTTATIYVNNVLKTTINTSGTQSTSVTDFTFGAHPTVAVFYNVNIDQARFFNKALNSTEVTTLYNETACTVTPPTYSTYSAYFNGIDEYITRTPLTASNRQIFTINFWFNTSQTTRGFIINQGNDGNDFFTIEINNGKINCGGYDGGNTIVLGTIDSYNDAKWHNYQIAIDTTQATSTNRAKVYIDGVQITSFSTGGNGVVYPSLNYSFQFNTTKTLQIGRLVNSNALYYDGYISSMSVVDGQQLTADSFIEYDAPKWIPKEYTGSYGTNGFFLNFSDADELGTDTSGNGNNFTEVNMDSSNQHNNFYR